MTREQMIDEAVRRCWPVTVYCSFEEGVRYSWGKNLPPTAVVGISGDEMDRVRAEFRRIESFGAKPPLAGFIGGP